MAEENSKHDFDPGRDRLATTYAQSLLAVAERQGKSEEVLEELDSLIEDVFDKLPQLEATLASLRVEDEEQVAILDKAFAANMSPLLLDFLKVLARHDRFELVRDIRDYAWQKLHELRGRVEVQISTAVALSEAEKAAIVEKISSSLGKELVVTATVDPSLLGGLLVRIGDTLFDGSLSWQFKRIKQQMGDRARREFRTAIEKYAVDTQ
jgi:F-type H+-transporting ATPase subunit delta